VRLKDSNNETEKPLDNKKTKAKQIRKIVKSGEEKIQITIEENANSKNKSINRTHENNEDVFKDKKDAIEVEGEVELTNARKKRRRSSANIE
jgi:ribonuclease E